MIEGKIGEWSTSKEMVFTNSNEENQKLHNDITKSPQRNGRKPLSTINGPLFEGGSVHSRDLPFNSSPEKKYLTEEPLDEYRNRYQSLFRVSSEDSDLDEVDRMLPGVLAEGMAYTVKETLMLGYIEKKGSGFDWIGSRAWKKRWAVLVVRLRWMAKEENETACKSFSADALLTCVFFSSLLRFFRKQEPMAKT